MTRDDSSTNSQQPAGPSGEPQPVRRAAWTRTVLFVLLLAAGVFAAIQVRTFLIRAGSADNPLDRAVQPAPRRAPSTRPTPFHMNAQPPSRPAAPASSSAGGPEAFAPGAWLPPEVMQPFEGDPLDIAPPEGSSRMGGFARKVMGADEQQATYQNERQSVAQLADVYREELTGRHFRLIRDSGGEDRRDLAFLSGATVVYVSLRKARQDTNIVEFSVTVSTRGAVHAPERSGNTE